MNPKKDFKQFFESILGAQVEIQGETLTPEESTRKQFCMFVDNYKKAIIRSVEVEEKYNLGLWEWEDLFAKSLEGLIYYTFEDYIAELILWFIYEHHLSEDEKDQTVTDEDGNQYLIKDSNDLYDLILLYKE